MTTAGQQQPSNSHNNNSSPADEMDVDDIKAEPIHNDESFETKETLAVSTFNRPGSSSPIGNNNNNNGRASVSSPSAASSATPSPLSPHLQLTPPNVSIASVADSATPFSVSSSSSSSSKCTSNSRTWSRDC